MQEMAAAESLLDLATTADNTSPEVCIYKLLKNEPATQPIKFKKTKKEKQSLENLRGALEKVTQVSISGNLPGNLYPGSIRESTPGSIRTGQLKIYPGGPPRFSYKFSYL